MVKGIIFDLDGVIADSFVAVTKFLEDTLIEAGYQKPSPEEIKATFHLPRPEALKALSRTESRDELKRLLLISNKVPYPHDLMETMPGAKEMVEKLSAMYPLGITTSKMRPNTEEFLRRFNLKNFFRAIVTYEDTNEHKPHPEPLILTATRLGFVPNDCVYVGDSDSDVIAARACSMKAIGYTDNVTEDVDLKTNDLATIPILIRSLL